MERWTDWQLIKALVLIIVIFWGLATFINGPLIGLLAFFGMSF